MRNRVFYIYVDASKLTGFGRQNTDIKPALDRDGARSIKTHPILRVIDPKAVEPALCVTAKRSLIQAGNSPIRMEA
jgi:hypothetical protein